MADFDSSLPVRTQSPGDIISKLADATTPSQQLAISAAGAAKVDGSAVTQPVSGPLTDAELRATAVPVSGPLTDAQLRATAVPVSGTVTANQGGSPWAQNITQIAGVAVSSAQGMPSRLTDGSAYYDARDIRALSSATDSVTAILATSAGDPINDYANSSGTGPGSSNDHDYTVTAGKTLLLSQLEMSSSGKAKVDLQIETGVATGVFITYFTAFNSSANPNASIRLSAPMSVAAGVRVRAESTNRDLSAEDIYTTICGSES